MQINEKEAEALLVRVSEKADDTALGCLGELARQTRMHARVAIVIMVILQFILPIPSAWYHWAYPAGAESIPEGAPCAYECDRCADLDARVVLQTMDWRSFANMARGTSNFKFYGRSGDVCRSRTAMVPTHYYLATSCVATLAIRDCQSCAQAAEALLPVGVSKNTCAVPVQAAQLLSSDLADHAVKALNNTVALIEKAQGVLNVTQEFGVLQFSGDTGCSIKNRFGEGSLELCFSKLGPATQVGWLLVALLLSLAWTSTYRVQRPRELNMAEKVRRGARRAAAVIVYKQAYRALFYRVVQVLHVVGWFQIWILMFEPLLVLAYFLILFLPAAVADNGWSLVMRKPIHIFVPNRSLVEMQREMRPQTVARVLLLVFVPPSFGLVGLATLDPTQGLDVMSPGSGTMLQHVVALAYDHKFANRLALQHVLIESEEAFVYCFFWAALTIVGSAIFSVLTLGMIAHWSCCLPDAASAEAAARREQFAELAAQLEKAAVYRLEHCTESAWRFKEAAPEFPAGYKPTTVLEPLPVVGGIACLGKLRIYPGALLLSALGLLQSMAAEAVAWSNVMASGQYFMGAVLASGSWTSTFLSIRRSLWQRSGASLQESLISGIETDDWIKLSTQMNNFEMMLNLSLSSYTFLFSNLGAQWYVWLASAWSVWSVLYSTAGYLRDTIDLCGGPLEDAGGDGSKSSMLETGRAA